MTWRSTRGSGSSQAVVSGKVLYDSSVGVGCDCDVLFVLGYDSDGAPWEGCDFCASLCVGCDFGDDLGTPCGGGYVR